MIYFFIKLTSLYFSTHHLSFDLCPGIPFFAAIEMFIDTIMPPDQFDLGKVVFNLFLPAFTQAPRG